MQSFSEMPIATFRAVTEPKCLIFCQSQTFDFILTQLNPTQTQDSPISTLILSSQSRPHLLSFHPHYVKYFMPHCISVSLSSPSTPVLLFHGLDTISENCYCSQALYTGRFNNPCATEQEECCTVLKVGKSYTPNPLCGIRDITHVVPTSTNRAL